MSIMSPSPNETSSIVSVWSSPVRAHPSTALPPNPSFSWQLLPGLRNMPPGTFFFQAPTFLLIASVSYGAVIHSHTHTLAETSRQVMPLTHCHISFSPNCSSATLTNRGGTGREGGMKEEERRGVFGSVTSCFRKQKAENCRPLLSKNFLGVKMTQKMVVDNRNKENTFSNFFDIQSSAVKHKPILKVHKCLKWQKVIWVIFWEVPLLRRYRSGFKTGYKRIIQRLRLHRLIPKCLVWIAKNLGLLTVWSFVKGK